MPTEFSIDTINDYFTTLNPIAARISFDIDETKSAYEHIWSKLNDNEHTEIINDTLMRPEISLRYFDNFSITTSTSSLLSIMTPSQTEDYKKPLRQSHNSHLSLRKFYEFDGRNLSTYAGQKIGLKLAHDETLGTFRDSHSMPFSFKTKSQINLRLFQDEEVNNKQTSDTNNPNHDLLAICNKMKESKLPLDSNTAQSSTKMFKLLQTEFAQNLSNRSKTEYATRMQENPAGIGQHKKSFDKINAKYKQLYEGSTTAQCVRNQIGYHGELSLLKFISKNGKSIDNAFHHTMYGYDEGKAGDEEDNCERANLMMNCNDITTPSSSVPSDDDQKTICEDLKLLDNDGLRKGFDFLNNW